MGLYDRDYMHGERPFDLRKLLWPGLILVGALAIAFLWSRQILRKQAAFMANLANVPPPKLLQVKTTELGSFDIVSGEAAICDPSYDRMLVQQGGIAKKVSGLEKGKWHGQAVIYEVDAPGHLRCAELIAVHELFELPAEPLWKSLHPDIGVDSGQAGIFDWRHFQSDALVKHHKWKAKMLLPEMPWYSMCGDVTLHEPYAGVVPYGVVSQSGWGDGGYPAYFITNEAGSIVALRLVFIEKGELRQADEKDQ
jgi:hypothetical protein